MDDAEGRWTIDCKATGKHWIGVRAEGSAVWEGSVDVADTPAPLTITLPRGVTFAARFAVPAGEPGLKMKLVPERMKIGQWKNDEHAIKTLGCLDAEIPADGGVRIDDVRPDTYMLHVFGEGLLERLRMLVVVPAEGVDLGRVEMAGLGHVEGEIHQPDEPGGKPWSFADGAVDVPDDDSHHGLTFKADEQGRFAVRDVPSGTVSVGFSYMISSDIIGTYQRYAVIEPGRTTKVRFFDPKQAWDLPVRIVVGDGSQAAFESGSGMGPGPRVDNVTDRDPMFRVELEPKPGQLVSYPETDWEEIKSADMSRILVRDVHPGAYHLRVRDWHGSIGILTSRFETDVDFRPGMELRIPLGGSSIAGKLKRTADRRPMAQVVAVREGADRPASETWSDAEGNFCVRYLEAGNYTLFAHHEEIGWSRLGPVEVGPQKIVDAVIEPLAPGGSVSGKAVLRTGRRFPDAVFATDSHGVTLLAPDFEGVNGQSFTLSHLWPDEWTVTLRSGVEILATAKVRVQGRETVPCDLMME